MGWLKTISTVTLWIEQCNTTMLFLVPACWGSGVGEEVSPAGYCSALAWPQDCAVGNKRLNERVNTPWRTAELHCPSGSLLWDPPQPHVLLYTLSWQDRHTLGCHPDTHRGLWTCGCWSLCCMTQHVCSELYAPEKGMSVEKHTWIFIAALFTIAPEWEQPIYLSIGKWINKIWFAYACIRLIARKGMKSSYMLQHGWTLGISCQR